LAFSITAYIASLNPACIPKLTPGWKGFFNLANYLVLGYLRDWGNSLAMYVTFLLAFAAFWVISDTRHFRHLDDRTKAISNISIWTAETLKHVSIPARYSADMDELKRNISDCRVELMNKVAESIKVFQEARMLVTDIYTEKQAAQNLEIAINNADTALRSYVTELWDINIATFSQAELNELLEEVTSITTVLRNLMEAVSNISQSS